MSGRQFLAKLMATAVIFLLVIDTTPAAALLPHGFEKMLPVTVGGGRVGSRKMNAGREEGIRSLRSLHPSPPPPPSRSRQTALAVKAPPPPLLLQ
ncbi:CASP-like protein 4A1 [Sesbania bispinosa]|nr:CASP-like protein 4A1 [Sesbania bispinosa]